MSGSTFMLLLRLGLSLGLVLGMIWGAAKILRSKGGFMLRGGGARLEIIERKQLGKTSSVALVRVDGQTLVLGVSEHQVQVLVEVPTAGGVSPFGADPDTTIVGQEIAPGVPTVGRPTVITMPAIASSTSSSDGVRAERTSFVGALRDLTVRKPSASARSK